MTGRKWLKLLAGCVVFGFLMGIRQEFSQMWLRVVVAGLAFGILAATTCWVKAGRT